MGDTVISQSGENRMSSIETERLCLRAWLPSDEQGFIEMNQDSQVMEFFPNLLTPEESIALIRKIQRHFDTHGYGLWACTLKSGEFMGFIGLNIPDFQAAFTPCVEIGWRLAAQYWGQGFATEGAKAVLSYAEHQLGLKDVVSFTVLANRRSRRVMEKLGMTHDPSENFHHPKLPLEHPCSMHVLYRKQF